MSQNEWLSEAIRAAYSATVEETIKRGWLMQPVPGTPEYERQLAEREAWLAERKAKRLQEEAERHERWREVMGRTHGLVSDIAMMHKPYEGEYGSGECDACRDEVEGDDYWMRLWPCATFLKIEESL